MSEVGPTFETQLQEPLHRPRGHPILAWIVIVVVCLSTVLVILFAPEIRRQRHEVDQERLGLVFTSLYARYLVGMADLLGDKKAALAQIETLNRGPVEERWAFIVLVGEFQGPEQALAKLDELDREIVAQHVQLDATDRAIEATLRRLYGDLARQDLDAPSPSPADRELLRQRLGWFGEFALAPAGDPESPARQAVLRAARQTFVVILGGVALFALACLAGLMGLLVLFSLLFAGQLRGGLHAPSGYGAIYAETFALYLLLMVGLSLGAAWLSAGSDSLLLSGVVVLLSLVALAWPVARGVPWLEVRRDIGLIKGRRPALEPVIGVGCYAMALPLLVVGLIATLLLLTHQTGLNAGSNPAHDFAPSPSPTHPIIGYLVQPGWRLRLEAFFVACIVAPIVEETMFRGVLYRHLRDASARLGSVMSVIVSATIVSFLFASVHPQGPLAIPALMSLAYGLTLAREWRVTLVPGMVAHGINNGLLLLLLSLALGG
jgi:membrane protease YdiL (CAAX protease family)